MIYECPVCRNKDIALENVSIRPAEDNQGFDTILLLIVKGTCEFCHAPLSMKVGLDYTTAFVDQILSEV